MGVCRGFKMGISFFTFLMLLTYIISLFLGLTRASTGSAKQFYLQDPSNLAAPKQYGIGFDFSPSHGLVSRSVKRAVLVRRNAVVSRLTISTEVPQLVSPMEQSCK